MDGAEYLVEAEPMFHREHEFRKKISRVFTDNSHAQDAILSWRSQNLDEALRSLV